MLGRDAASADVAHGFTSSRHKAQFHFPAEGRGCFSEAGDGERRGGGTSNIERPTRQMGSGLTNSPRPRPLHKNLRQRRQSRFASCVSVNINFYFPTHAALRRVVSNPPVEKKIYPTGLRLTKAWNLDGDVESDGPEPESLDWQTRARIYSDLMFGCATLTNVDNDVHRSSRSVVCFLSPFIDSLASPMLWDDVETPPYPIAGQLLSPATTRRLLATYATIDWKSLRVLEPAVEAASLRLPWADFELPLEMVTSVDLLHAYLNEYARLCQRAQQLGRYTYVIAG